jgi:hypothetical protein
MQFERDSFYEVSQVVCTTDTIRVWRTRGAADRDCPAMSVVGVVRCLPFSRSKDYCSVSINDRSVYCNTLDVAE